MLDKDLAVETLRFGRDKLHDMVALAAARQLAPDRVLDRRKVALEQRIHLLNLEEHSVKSSEL